MLNNRPVQVYAEGKLLRYFTFIDDIIGGIIAILRMQSEEAPPVLMNIGNNNPITVNELVEELGKALGRKAKREYLPMQPGDVEKTFADIDLIKAYCCFKPNTDLNTGLRIFCD